MMIEFMKEIENKYSVSSINVSNMQVWPFLREAYYSQYGRRYIFNTSNKNNDKINASFLKLKRLRNIFYGFWNLFKKYDYMLFSDTFEKRLVNGKYIDKIAESLINVLGQERVLLIENPINGLHFNRSKISIKNIISLDLFCVFCNKYFFKKKVRIINEEILEKINNKYGININYQGVIAEFIFYKNWFKFFYKIYKPKLIFINCYYSLLHQAAIYAAENMGIKTVELQHGIISSRHPAYNIFTNLDKAFFPDYLLAFGDYTKNIFNEENYFIKRENVLSIGSMYIDYINNNYQPLKETVQIFINFRKKYKKIVAISSQAPIENKLIMFLKKSALLSKDILYIFVPRDLKKNYSNANFPKNIIILKHLDVYKIIREVDFHSTLWSTCALEAPAMGVPNILINIEGFAKKHYLDILTNRNITRFVNTEVEFVNEILSWHPKTKREIMNLHNDFYKENHGKNLRYALKVIGVA